MMTAGGCQKGIFDSNPKYKSTPGLLSKNKNIVIDACDGSEILENAKDLFPQSNFSSFKRSHISNKPGKATEDIAVQVYEMQENITIAQMFCYSDADLNKLCLTQHQIITFCKKYPKWLQQYAYGTLFLLKSDEKFSFILVYTVSDGMGVVVNRFENVCLWEVRGGLRVVVPQLTP